MKVISSNPTKEELDLYNKYFHYGAFYLNKETSKDKVLLANSLVKKNFLKIINVDSNFKYYQIIYK